jgi:hypothetical protein
VLHDWTNLFNITGAAGGQLIGLLFVVVTLGTGLTASQSENAIRAFVTPILVNFSGVLFQAVVVLAPWPSERPAGVLLVLGGLAGGIYRLATIRLKGKADFVALSGFDWVAYNGVPVLANLSLIAGGVGLIVSDTRAPYAIAAASTLLLAAGIYGAWDLTLRTLKSRSKV